MKCEWKLCLVFLRDVGKMKFEFLKVGRLCMNIEIEGAGDDIDNEICFCKRLKDLE